MAELFNVRRPNGKLAAQHHTRELADREVRWQLASGAEGPLTIERIEREPDCSRWGWGYPNRFAGKWPRAKLDEFQERYGRGEPVIDVAEYFGTNFVVVTRMARRLGFGRRIDDPSTFEKHRGRWTQREKELINALYDEAESIGFISDNHSRTRKAIEFRLSVTAPTLSTRSRFGRFVTPGRKKIRPVLEETS